MIEGDPSTGGTRRSWAARIVGAAALDTSVYNEVEHDASATGQAVGVIMVVAVASVIGGTGSAESSAVGGIVGALAGWLVWAGVTYLVGAKLFGGTATWGELLRTLGFAQSPGILYVAAALPFLGGLIEGLVEIWILVAVIVAIREALDVSTGKAILTALLGWFFLALLALLTLSFASPAAVGS